VPPCIRARPSRTGLPGHVGGRAVVQFSDAGHTDGDDHQTQPTSSRRTFIGSIDDEARVSGRHPGRWSTTAEAIRGTAWGAYQAITEYTDHFAPIGEKRNPGAARAERAITSANVAAVKTRAFDLLAAN
jgi:hypothetical protein